jgi:hypothetical protein
MSRQKECCVCNCYFNDDYSNENMVLATGNRDIFDTDPEISTKNSSPNVYICKYCLEDENE